MAQRFPFGTILDGAIRTLDMRAAAVRRCPRVSPREDEILSGRTRLDQPAPFSFSAAPRNYREGSIGNGNYPHDLSVDIIFV
jgi:hypothetical protein